MEVTQCPWKEVTPDVWRLYEAVDFARKGILPVAGGTQNQTRAFMTVLREAYRHEAGHRAKAGCRD